METTTKRQPAPDWPNVISGIWLVISPFVLSFSQNTSALWNNVWVGAAVIALAFIGGKGAGALRGLSVFLGAWLFISPFLLGFSHQAFLWNNVVMAFLVIAGAAISEGLHPVNSANSTP